MTYDLEIWQAEVGSFYATNLEVIRLALNGHIMHKLKIGDANRKMILSTAATQMPIVVYS